MDSRTVSGGVSCPGKELLEVWMDVDGCSSLIPFACLKYRGVIHLPVHLGKEIVCYELPGELARGICLVPVRFH